MADARTGNLVSSGDSALVAQTGGYHLAFLVGALFAAAAAVLGALLLHPSAAPTELPVDAGASAEPAHAGAGGRD